MAFTRRCQGNPDEGTQRQAGGIAGRGAGATFPAPPSSAPSPRHFPYFVFLRIMSKMPRLLPCISDPLQGLTQCLDRVSHVRSGELSAEALRTTFPRASCPSLGIGAFSPLLAPLLYLQNPRLEFSTTEPTTWIAATSSY